MGRRYLNAERVLPPEVFAAVVQATGGGPTFLWVPNPSGIARCSRDAYAVRLASEGKSIRAVAGQLSLSERQVYRILASAKNKQQGESI